MQAHGQPDDGLGGGAIRFTPSAPSAEVRDRSVWFPVKLKDAVSACPPCALTCAPVAVPDLECRETAAPKPRSCFEDRARIWSQRNSWRWNSMDMESICVYNIADGACCGIDTNLLPAAHLGARRTQGCCSFMGRGPSFLGGGRCSLGDRSIIRYGWPVSFDQGLWPFEPHNQALVSQKVHDVCVRGGRCQVA